MKTITIDGRRYRLATRSWDGRVTLDGPGILRGCCLLADGATQDAPNLRELAVAAIAAYRERSREAALIVRDAVRLEQIESQRASPE